MSNNITLQKIFDLAWKHFIVDNQPPAAERISSGIRCKYLTTDGRKCAVGLALPDSHPCQDTQQSFEKIVALYPYLFDESVCKANPADLYAFQARLHDDLINRKTGEWEHGVVKRKMAYLNVARDFNLKLPEGEGHEPTEDNSPADL